MAVKLVFILSFFFFFKEFGKMEKMPSGETSGKSYEELLIKN